MTTTLTDADLLGRCREGDQDAWRQLVERFSPYVYAIVARAYRLEPDDAEDVFQEVFVRTYEHLDRIRDDAAIRPWIGQLARRLAIDRLRELGRLTSDEELVAESGAPDETLERLDEALTVRAALATLSEDCNEIIDRFFARDESYRTIAAALEIPMGTIASRISRCLGRLRVALEGSRQASAPSGKR